MLKTNNPFDNTKIDDYKDTVKQLKESLSLYYSNSDEPKLASQEIDAFSQEFGDVDDAYIEKYANANWYANWAQHVRRSYPNLYKLAERLFQMPAGATSTQRAWSAFSFVYTKARNQLSSETLSKLVFVYVNRKLLDQDDDNDYANEDNFFGTD